MRPELEEIQYIEEYLLNKLSKEEKEAFEQRLKTDAVFAQKVKVQRVLIQRIGHLSAKHTVAQAHRNYLKKQSFPYNLRNSGKFYRSIFGFSIIVIIAYLVIISEENLFNSDKDSSEPLLQLPIKGVDVPFESQFFNADSGAVLNYKTGSSVIIPASSFVDENGNPVTGKVELKFREFRDVADIYLAGIPMHFEQEGENLVLESAAMCEINAFKDGKALKIKQGKKIEIMQTSYTQNNDFNLYRFDKNEGKWIEKGKDTPLDLNTELTGKTNFGMDEKTASLYNEPIKPKNIDEAKNSISVNFEESEFPELAIYKNVEFVIDENDKTYNPSHADIVWEDVYLKKGPNQGSFIITFTKGTKKVSYKVYPGFRDKNYENAMIVYNKKLKEYNSIREDRILKEKMESRELLLNNRKQDSINKLIIARNASINANNQWLETSEAHSLSGKARAIIYSNFVEQEIKDKIVNAEKNFENLQGYKNLIEGTLKQLVETEQLYRKRSIILRQTFDIDLRTRLLAIEPKIKQVIANKEFIETAYTNFRQDRLKRLEEKEKEQWNRLETTQKIMRIYSIDQIGIWNCDQPIRYSKGMTLMASFSLNNKQLPLNNINLVDKEIRSVFSFEKKDFDQFKCNPAANNVIWTVIDGNKLIYFNEFNTITDDANNKAYIFEMKEIKEPLTDYETVKRIINSL
ncbi:MAG: hypothetical protein U0W24_16735 [Bacteroidales bacterium]